MFRMIAVSMVAALSVTGPIRPAARAGDPVAFTVRIENLSNDALKLSTGGTAPAPTAPVLWAVHTTGNLLFETGRLDRGLGLERLAEDGDPSRLAAALQGSAGVLAAGFVNTPEGDVGAGPITPGKAYEFTVKAQAGQSLTLAFMFGQSNDLFYAPDGSGIALFDRAGRPVSGDITKYFQLWDAGTEVNQEPGVGADQAPRQKMANTGAAEAKPVGPVHDAYSYPKTNQVIRVTITPVAM
jgi:hypothetical protein